MAEQTTVEKSNLDLVKEADCFPYYESDQDAYLRHVATYYILRVEGRDENLGYVYPKVVDLLENVPAWKIDEDERTLTLVGCNTQEERTAIITSTTESMRKLKHFEVLAKWRNERYPIYGRDGSILFEMERSATPLFGVQTYGVHLTAYVRDAASGAVKIWVPRRARSKQTYGGMLDNTVAGGMAVGEEPTESLIRESAEEASLDEDLVRKTMKPAGTVTYWYIRDARAGGETNLLQPECQYVYDLELPADVEPKPCDDEVEQFYLWPVEEVRASLARGEWKPNSAVCMIDFFVRHGFINDKNEKDYIEICQRMHRRMEFPTR